MDRFEKVKADLEKATMEDPDAIFVTIDFPTKALTKYLDSVDKFEEESKNSKLVFKK